MSTQSIDPITSHAIVATNSTLNYFKTIGNIIMIEYKHFEEMCKQTDARIFRILNGEYRLEIVNACKATKPRVPFTLCINEEVSNNLLEQSIYRKHWILKQMNKKRGAANNLTSGVGS